MEPSLQVDLHRAFPPRFSIRPGGALRTHVMLDGDADGEEQLALRGEEVHLRLRRDDLIDRLAEQLTRLAEETPRADTTLVAQLPALPKITRSIPSSSFADLVTLPLSTRGSAISRL